MSPEILKEIITTPMPYGKYKGTMIADLPSYYLEWFSTQGDKLKEYVSQES